MKSKSKSKNVAPALLRFDWAMKRLLRQKANYTSEQMAEIVRHES